MQYLILGHLQIIDNPEAKGLRGSSEMLNNYNDLLEYF